MFNITALEMDASNPLPPYTPAMRGISMGTLSSAGDPSALPEYCEIIMNPTPVSDSLVSDESIVFDESIPVSENENLPTSAENAGEIIDQHPIPTNANVIPTNPPAYQ